jgi:hypothetical protein
MTGIGEPGTMPNRYSMNVRTLSAVSPRFFPFSTRRLHRIRVAQRSEQKFAGVVVLSVLLTIAFASGQIEGGFVCVLKRKTRQVHHQFGNHRGALNSLLERSNVKPG